jgi:hypothetical protein
MKKPDDKSWKMLLVVVVCVDVCGVLSLSCTCWTRTVVLRGHLQGGLLLLGRWIPGPPGSSLARQWTRLGGTESSGAVWINNWSP